MKTPPPCIPALVVMLALVPAAAATADAESPADRARALGERSAQALQKQLGGALMQALRDGGPPAAVSVCADTAQALTARIARDLDAPGLRLKRTSLHLRNPANRPDSLETAVLRDFVQALGDGDRPAPRLERAPGGYRYFAPIVTRSLCLQCHGPVERLAEGVPAVLAERYPDDRATGHAKGDLRGIVSVTIPAGAVAE